MITFPQRNEADTIALNPTIPEKYNPSSLSESNINRIIEHRFGDGYMTSMPDGINYEKREYSLTWNNLPYKFNYIYDDRDISVPDDERSAGNEIEAFLNRVVKLIPFKYRLPDTGKYVTVKCIKVGSSETGDKFEAKTINAIFETFY